MSIRPRVIVTSNQKHFGPEHLERWGIVAIPPDDFLLKLYEQNPDAVWRQIGLAAEQKGMLLGELVNGYSAQLGRFRAALLADLP